MALRLAHLDKSDARSKCNEIASKNMKINIKL